MLKETIKFVAAMSIAAGCSAHAQDYKFTPLTFPGGNSLTANARNDGGETVGSAYDQDGIDKAVVWHKGVPTVLQGLGDAGSAAFAINRHGQSVGYSFDSYYGQQAVQWDGGVPKVLKRPAHTWNAAAVAINARGHVAGNAFQFYGGPSQAVRWVRGKPVVLDSLGGSASVARSMNGAGEVVGYIDSPHGSGDRTPVVWRGNAATVLDSLVETQCCNEASSINDSGQIVGRSSSPDGVRAVVWNGTKPTALQALSNADSALAVNNQQQAVGASNIGGFTRAALWNLSSGEGVDLNSFLTAAQRKAGWVLSSAHDINDRGAIVGIVFNEKTGSFSAFQLVPISEP